MSNFQVGDVVEIIGAPDVVNTWHLKYIGTTATVIGFEFGPSCSIRLELHDGETGPMWLQHHLRLKRPPANYDGNQAGDWELCPWQPYREKTNA
jgi:ribosomal protein L21E